MSSTDVVDKSLQTYGRITTYMGSFVGCIILLAFLAAGIYMITKAINTRKYMKETSAQIISVFPYSRNSYNIGVTYMVNGKQYNSSVRSSVYKIMGGSMTIYYDYRNPVIISSTSNTTQIIIGSLLVLCAIIFFIYLVMNVHIVRKSDLAAEGAAISSLTPISYYY